MVHIIIYGLLSVALFLISWIAIAQSSKTRKLEELLEISLKNLENIYMIIQESKNLLDNPQLKQAFSEDDEVGAFFKNIEYIQETLNQFIKPQNEKD